MTTEVKMFPANPHFDKPEHTSNGVQDGHGGNEVRFYGGMTGPATTEVKQGPPGALVQIHEPPRTSDELVKLEGLVKSLKDVNDNKKSESESEKASDDDEEPIDIDTE